MEGLVVMKFKAVCKYPCSDCIREDCEQRRNKVIEKR